MTAPKIRWTDRWSVIFTGGILLATLAYAVVSSCQLSTMRAQLETTKSQLNAMKAQMETADRPWLVFRSAQRLELERGILPKDIKIYLFNTGHGPALKVQARVGSFGIALERVDTDEKGRETATPLQLPIGNVRIQPEDVPKKLGPWQHVGSIVAGGLERELDVPLDTTSVEKVAAILDGNAQMYVAAEVKYLDQFGHEHHSSSCMLFVPKTKDWRICEEHLPAD